MIITGETTKSTEKKQDEKFLETLLGTESIMLKKCALQEKALNLSNEYSHLVLSWATGCGKSLAALRIIQSRIDAGDKTPWFIVCSELNHIDNWISEIVKHKLGYLMEHIEIFCYASLGKYKNKKANLILDESHSVSDLRLDYLQTITANNIVSLSATLNSERKDQLKKLRPFREFEVTITDAINTGILPAPQIYVIYDKLNNLQNSQYYTYIKKKGEHMKRKPVTVPILDATYENYISVMSTNKDLLSYNLHIRCNQQQYYELITKDLEYYKKAYNAAYGGHFRNNLKLKMLRLGNDRKKFTSDKKGPILVEINNMLLNNSYRFITFTGSIEQADMFGADRVIHSKVPEKRRKEIIKDFNEKKINSIYAVQMLREGQNFEDIEAGIITQLDSEDLSFVQMMGRVFRSTNPLLFVIVKDNTQDITYLKNCIAGLDSKYITYIEWTTENMKLLNQVICQRKSQKNS